MILCRVLLTPRRNQYAPIKNTLLACLHFTAIQHDRRPSVLLVEAGRVELPSATLSILRHRILCVSLCFKDFFNVLRHNVCCNSMLPSTHAPYNFLINFFTFIFLIYTKIGGSCRDRTYDQLVKSQMLYL